MKKVVVALTIACSILFNSRVTADSMQDGNIIRIDDSYYSTLNGVIQDIEEEGTITLIDNINLDTLIKNDTTLFLNVTLDRNNEVVEQVPPKTSDINLVIVISMIVTGIIGTFILLKYRFYKKRD